MHCIPVRQIYGGELNKLTIDLLYKNIRGIDVCLSSVDRSLENVREDRQKYPDGETDWRAESRHEMVRVLHGNNFEWECLKWDGFC